MRSLLIGIFIWVLADILDAKSNGFDIKDIIIFYYVINCIYLEKVILYYKEKLKNMKGDDTS